MAKYELTAESRMYVWTSSQGVPCLTVTEPNRAEAVLHIEMPDSLPHDLKRALERWGNQKYGPSTKGMPPLDTILPGENVFEVRGDGTMVHPVAQPAPMKSAYDEYRRTRPAALNDSVPCIKQLEAELVTAHATTAKMADQLLNYMAKADELALTSQGLMRECAALKHEDQGLKRAATQSPTTSCYVHPLSMSELAEQRQGNNEAQVAEKLKEKAEQPPAATCRGSYSLGTQCGVCSKCAIERVNRDIPEDWHGKWDPSDPRTARVIEARRQGEKL
jgi:hypothetical protein